MFAAVSGPLAGDPAVNDSTYFSGFPADKVSPISCPDNIAFDTERWPYGLVTLTRTHPLVLHYVRTGSPRRAEK